MPQLLPQEVMEDQPSEVERWIAGEYLFLSGIDCIKIYNFH